jgi:hypothetical protein
MRGADDTAARRAPGTAGSPGLRAAGLAAGCLLALAATAVVFLTDDPQVLRIAVVAAAWACLAAAFAAGRRRGRGTPEAEPPPADTAAIEAELRRAYDRELEREVAARQQYELELESQVRREAEEAMRAELDGLRAELAGLREGLSGLTALREEVAAVAALRGQLAELGGLRADVGRLRAELTEQLSGEMLVERLVMRTQSVRTAPGRESLEPATAAWQADVPRDLTAAWPVLPLDDRGAEETPRGTTVLPQVPFAPAAAVAAPAVVREPEPALRPLPPLPPVPLREDPRDAAGGSPREWLTARGVLDDVALPAGAAADDGALRRRRTDPVGAPAPAPAPAEQLTVERPAVHTAAAGYAASGRSGPPYAPAAPGTDGAGGSRLAQILAESGVTPGGRRHRYRDEDEDEGQDPAARVLGRG